MNTWTERLIEARTGGIINLPDRFHLEQWLKTHRCGVDASGMCELQWQHDQRYTTIAFRVIVHDTGWWIEIESRLNSDRREVQSVNIGTCHEDAQVMGIYDAIRSIGDYENIYL